MGEIRLRYHRGKIRPEHPKDDVLFYQLLREAGLVKRCSLRDSGYDQFLATASRHNLEVVTIYPEEIK